MENQFEISEILRCEDMSQQLTLVNIICILIFFTLHYSTKKGVKKPLFYVIIKVRTILKQQNRGAFTMSIYSLNEKLKKIKPQDREVVINFAKEQANKKPILPKLTVADETPLDEPTGEILEDVSASGKPRKWKQHKQDNLRLAELYKEANKKYPRLISSGRLWDMEQCANALQFIRYADGSKKLFQAYFCRNRLCPMCQWRRSLKLFGQVSQITDLLMVQYSGVRFLFVTFTQANISGTNLKTEFDRVNKAFARLTDKTKNVAAAKGLQKSLLGYIKSTEVTYNSKTKTYHPHLHCVFAVKSVYFSGGKYLGIPQWRALWRDMLHLDYLPQVNVQAIKTGADKKAVAELIKYPAKVTSILDLPTADAVQVLADLTRFCRNRRFVSFGGCFKTAKQQLHLQDVEASNADLVAVDRTIDKLNVVGRIMYKYNSKFGCYIS